VVGGGQLIRGTKCSQPKFHVTHGRNSETIPVVLLLGRTRELTEVIMIYIFRLHPAFMRCVITIVLQLRGRTSFAMSMPSLENMSQQHVSSRRMEIRRFHPEN
jgi:hypothetical protein